MRQFLHMTSLFMVTSIHSIQKKTPQETARNSQKNVRLEDKGRFKDQKRGIKLRLKKCLTKNKRKVFERRYGLMHYVKGMKRSCWRTCLKKNVATYTLSSCMLFGNEVAISLGSYISIINKQTILNKLSHQLKLFKVECHQK